MFPLRHWCERFFASRYWPKVGSDQSHVVTAIVFAVPRRAVLKAPARPILRVPPARG